MLCIVNRSSRVALREDINTCLRNDADNRDSSIAMPRGDWIEVNLVPGRYLRWIAGVHEEERSLSTALGDPFLAWRLDTARIMTSPVYPQDILRPRAASYITPVFRPSFLSTYPMCRRRLLSSTRRVACKIVPLKRSVSSDVPSPRLCSH
jgi:hypothetical protein